MSEEKNYKKTLNILKTNFEMKANLNISEPTIQNFWLEKKIYQKVLKKNFQREQKTLHDGPPYANGNIHVGHALNKILKDVIVRYFNMCGFYSHYIPGWDTHGLPIEHALIKIGKNTDKSLTTVQKIQNCRNFASTQIETQKKQFMRLGMFADFADCYYTYDNNFVADQLEVFLNAIEKKLVYQELKPVYWSWSSQTALAEAEVEYINVQSNSIFVSFEITDPKKTKLQKGDYLLIWTTTPWTIPSNLAIAVNPNFVYIRVRVDKKYFIIAKNTLTRIKEELGWKDCEVIDEISGKELEKIIYKHPILSQESPVILADYVIETNGTGLVHNAPGFGIEDYLACKKYNIHAYSPIDAYGKFTNEVKDEELVGIFYDDANEKIIDKLSKANALLKKTTFTHSVACDWRTKKPTIFRATKQWFINIDKIKSEILSSIKDVWFPSDVNRKQLTEMIENRVEWCISRQRYWGVPIPIIFNEKDEPMYDAELIKNIINIFKKESPDVWFEKPVEYFLIDKYKNKGNYRKETDILDVWFDSGTTFSVLKQFNLNYPAELYLEGKDQFRGWFNSSLINAVISTGRAPYKKLLGCGFVLDGEGRKMSKSLGNVIDPLVVCEKQGADILRLWVASVEYRDDVRISDAILNQTSEVYRRIRNSLFKFILSNISDFDYSVNKNTNFSEIDILILHQLSINVIKIKECYELFKFCDIIETINNHIINLSAWYFDIIKDTLYCDKTDSHKRRIVQTVLYTIIHTYLILLAPIIPHTCEEVYKHFNIENKRESVFLENWIDKIPYKINDLNIEKWNFFFDLKDIIFAELEKIRVEKIINKNTQASVEIIFDNTKFNFTEEELKYALNVAEVIVSSQKETKTTIVNVKKASNTTRCERCWNYFSNDKIVGDLCERCKKIISSTEKDE
ncbi:MAG: isoleucine--tRNA ligase [Mycoplasmataceae bacterium]|nr:isoleucine--tRNA ligase [Mycoplasmataceae bacterium]